MASSVLLLLCCQTVQAAYVTPWDMLSVALKDRARQWFIDRATAKGIDWTGTSSFYLDKVSTELEQRSALLADETLSYPAYYMRPFHGYDEGNLNWLAACELEASTESMSSGYFSDVNPKEGAARMRQTFASLVEDYAERNKARPLEHLVDLGCSIGISTEESLTRVKSLQSAVGVDLSPHFLSIAAHRAEQKELPMQFVHANIDCLDMTEGADLVTSQFVFHELPPEAIVNTIRAAHATLRPGGVFAVLDLDAKTLLSSLSGFRKWGFESTEPHIFTYYGQDIASLLAENGFELVEEHPNDPYNHAWIGVKSHTA